MHPRCEAIWRAAATVGGLGTLSGLLGVSMTQLQDWLMGRRIPPTNVFLAAVDIIDSPTHPPSHPPLS